jgi:quercetin 2,3-dioxygenase
MSKPTVGGEALAALGARQQRFDIYPAREVKLGEMPVARALPVKGRRLIGPWCFLDRFGPLAFAAGTPMDVAPHPHIGLQTVTWLVDGEVVHNDSLRNEALLRPGGVNVMTSGRAIAHAEQTPARHSGRLDGVQLWTALPDDSRDGDAQFQHLAEVPVLELPGGVVHLFSGTLAGSRSPAQHFSDLVGADLIVHPGHPLAVPLDTSFEHAVLVLGGSCVLDDQPLDPGALYYLGTQRTEATFSAATGARVLLIGGPPFPETILMWWNFIARTPDEIRLAREDWEGHRRFGDVPAYKGPRLPAPELMRLAAPNPVS